MKVKEKAGSLLNSSYNKTIYSGVVGASVDFLFGLLTEFGVDVSPDLQTKTLILAMAIVTLIVPNRQKPEGANA